MRFALEDAYRELDDPAKLAVAFENMADDDPGVRENAADLLSTVKDPQALSLLVRMLQDKDWRVLRAVVRGLELLGWQPSTPQEKVRSYATKQQWKDLAGFDPDRIFAELGGLLETDPARVQILRAAGLIRDGRALPILLRALQEGDSALCREASVSLDEIGWQPTSAVEKAFCFVAKERWEEALAAGIEGLPVVIRAAIRERRGDLLERILIRLHASLDFSSIPPAQALSLMLELLRGALPLLVAPLGGAQDSAAVASTILLKYTRLRPSFGRYQDPTARPPVLVAPILRRLAYLLFARLESSPEGFSEILRQLRELDPTVSNLLDKKQVLPSLSKMAYLIRPEWAEVPLSREQVRRFQRALSYLPPMGGKIPVVRPHPAPDLATGGLPRRGGILAPSLTAEEQIQTVRALHRSGALGAEYVHQLTVQGRLPDEFKYVAVALILSSPYRQDWNEPFFAAPWGSVAPLIHDGGNVRLGLNRFWRKIRGRTDFLQRVAVVYGKDKPDLEGMEQDRLLLEAKAYQRLALALHAAKGTAPKKTDRNRGGIPPDLYRRMAGRWEEFRTQMEMFLTEFGAADAVRLPWFLEEPRLVPRWDEHRLEADWPPIQKALLKLNQFAQEQPQLYDRLRLQIVALLKRVTDDIDRDLGLLPPLPPPTDSPGLTAGLEDGVEIYRGLFRVEGRTEAILPEKLVRDPAVGTRLKTGEAVTIKMEVDRIPATPLRPGRIFAQKGAAVPSVWRNLPRVLLSDDPAEAARQMEYYGADRADAAFLSEQAMQAPERWDQVFQGRMAGVYLSPEALEALELLIRRDPQYLDAFLVGLKKTSGFLAIFSVEVDEAIRGGRRLYLYA